ncbi:MAG: hypothetical protein ACT4OY_09115 [Alphaproteobacteria bacterium]
MARAELLKKIRKPSDKNRNALHLVAAAEAEGIDISGIPEQLLKEGVDPHQEDDDGNTPFNIAAPNSPITGRSMTNHWLDLALRNEGSKGLNDVSGYYKSTLAHYIAKWSNDDEIEAQIAAGVEAGMGLAALNGSGWTPLMSAAPTARLKAVEILSTYYTPEEIAVRTSHMYETYYNGHKVSYPAGITAYDMMLARLQQDKGLDKGMREALERILNILGPLSPRPISVMVPG